MNSTPLVCGAGVADGGAEVGGGVVEEVVCPLTEGVGVSAAPVEPESLKPFARTARPTTTRATITRTRPVLRFTRASYPQSLAGAAGRLERDPASLRRAPLASQRPEAAEPSHQHRVIGERARMVDGAV